ncbi:MAG: DUF3352 domain-containing protein [Candidatus Aminicenantes bacterium]|nr:DUF3352 domain-containing protein [Candidatus Aminicenantes bacterium]
MKKSLMYIISLSVCLLLILACGEKTKAPEKGAASLDSAMKILPMDSKAVFYVDLKKVMALESVDNALKSDKNYQQMQEIINKTGINPKEDIHYIIGAMTSLEKDNQTGVIVANLNYNRDSMINLIKEETEKEILESEYNGFTIYTSEEETEMGSFCFLDESNILIGDNSGIQAVIDIVKNNSENLLKNEEMSALMQQINKEALVWGAFLIPSEAVSEATSTNPMLANLDSVKAATIFFDFKNQNYSTEIKLISADPEKNQQVAELLNGLKAFGSMGAAENPALGDLMNKIEITASDEFVKIYANIPEDLINQLKTSFAGPETEK